MRVPPQIPAVPLVTSPMFESPEEKPSQSLLSFLGMRRAGVPALPCLIVLGTF